MGKWRPHIYRAAASKAEVDPSIVDAAIKAGKIVIAKNPDVPPIFSLGHLAHLSGAPYRYLREIVERQYDPYSIFTIRKRNVKSGFRTICVPPPPLMQLQRWLVEKVLNQGSPHTASTAFAPESSVLDAATPHVGCRWLIKVDIRNFFESISEIAAYRVFHEQFGFQKLVSFELARLCTRNGPSSPFRSRPRWWSNPGRDKKIFSYRTSKMGHLPQGAPTSPMLANLSVRAMDEGFQTIAESEGLNVASAPRTSVVIRLLISSKMFSACAFTESNPKPRVLAGGNASIASESCNIIEKPSPDTPANAIAESCLGSANIFGHASKYCPPERRLSDAKNISS